MIKPNELRIGNYVQWSDEPGVYVPWMHGHWLGTFNENYPFPEPIPLTSEWLLKFGFKMDLHMKLWPPMNTENRIYGSIHVYDDQHCGWALWIENIAIEIDYIHQLQNLHYALTGEELTI